MSSQAKQTGDRIAYLALVAAGCLWGTGFYFAKIDLAEMSVGHMLLYRFLFACVGLIPIMLMQRAVPRTHDIPIFLVTAALYVPVQSIVQFEGLARTTVSHASLMVGTVPLLLAVAAVLFTKERLDGRGWLLLGLSTIGAVLIVFQAHNNTAARGGPSLFGDVLVLASMCIGIAWVLVTQCMEHFGAGYSAAAMSGYIIVFGTAMLAVWVLSTEGLPPVAGISTHAWLALAAQGLLATTLPVLLWNWALIRVSAARAGIFVNVEPIVGAALGVLLLRESLGLSAVLGGVLIVGAALAFTYRAPAMTDTIVQ